MQRTATIKRRALKASIFMTLTYPADWPDDPQVWKSHLNTFSIYLKRAYPRVSGFWRMEPQDRGAPHFHLILFGQRFIPHEWTAATWNRIVAPGDLDHLAAGTETRRSRSMRQAVAYVSKYAAKITDQPFVTSSGEPLYNVGRHWGIIGRGSLPIADSITYLVPFDHREGALHFLASRSSRSSGYIQSWIPRSQTRAAIFDRKPEDLLPYLSAAGTPFDQVMADYYADRALWNRLYSLLLPLLRAPVPCFPADHPAAIAALSHITDPLPF